jgi:hypothetical protein
MEVLKNIKYARKIFSSGFHGTSFRPMLVPLGIVASRYVNVLKISALLATYSP